MDPRPFGLNADDVNFLPHHQHIRWMSTSCLCPLWTIKVLTISPKLGYTVLRVLACCSPLFAWQSNKTIRFCCCPVTQLWLILRDPMDCSTPCFPVLHYFLEFAQTRVHWVGDAILPSHSVTPFSSCPFLASESFLMSQLFASGGQSVGASASASVLPMNIQG